MANVNTHSHFFMDERQAQLYSVNNETKSFAMKMNSEIRHTNVKIVDDDSCEGSDSDSDSDDDSDNDRDSDSDSVVESESGSDSDFISEVEFNDITEDQRKSAGFWTSVPAECTVQEKPTATNLPAGWQVHFDHDQYNRAYYYNCITGESQWECPAYKSVATRRRNSFSSDSIQLYIDDTHSDQLQHNTKLPNEEYPSEILADGIEVSADSAINTYAIFSIFHIIVVEGPAASAEGIIQGLLNIILWTGYFFGFLLSSLLSHFNLEDLMNTELMRQQTKRCGKDGLGYFAAALTLAIPFGSMMVYRDFWLAWKEGRLRRQEENWRICCIPTLIGNVDPRRFKIFTSGHGSFAKNIEHTGGSYFPVLCD